MKPLRALIAELHLTPEERREVCAEQCMESLHDPERAPALHLGEHEEAAIEAERRRWATLHDPPDIA